MNFRRFLPTASVCLMLGLFAFHYLRPITMLCYTKWQVRNEPAMWVVPKPLPDITLAAAKGKKFSYFGYEFEAPWTEVKKERRWQSGVILNFSNGAAVLIFDPAGGLNELQVLRQESAKHGADVKAVFGEDATHSDYALRSKILNLTPGDLHLFSSRQEMVRHSIFLLLKSIQTKRIKGGLYSFQTKWFRGFQEGGPTEDKMALIDVWDANDRKVEIMVGSETGAPILSQAELNRILFSLHPISPPPVQ